MSSRLFQGELLLLLLLVTTLYVHRVRSKLFAEIKTGTVVDERQPMRYPLVR